MLVMSVAALRIDCAVVATIWFMSSLSHVSDCVTISRSNDGSNAMAIVNLGREFGGFNFGLSSLTLGEDAEQFGAMVRACSRMGLHMGHEVSWYGGMS